MGLHQTNSIVSLLVIAGILAGSSITWAAPAPTVNPRPGRDRGPSPAEIQAAADRARAEAEAINAQRRARRAQERLEAAQAVRTAAANFDSAVRTQRGENSISTLLSTSVNFAGPSGVAAADTFDPDRAASHLGRYTARRNVANDSLQIATSYDSLASTFRTDSEMPSIMRTYRPRNTIPGADTDDKKKWGQFIATLDQMGETRTVNSPSRMSAIAWMAAQEPAPTEAPTEAGYYVLPGHRPGAPGAPPVPPAATLDPGRTAAEKVKREATTSVSDLTSAISTMQNLKGRQERLDGEPPLEDPDRAARNAARAAKNAGGGNNGGGNQANNDSKQPPGGGGQGGGGQGGGGQGKNDAKMPEIQNLNLADGLGPFLSSLNQNNQDQKLDGSLFGPLEPVPIPSRDIANDFKVKDFPGFPNPFALNQKEKTKTQNTASNENTFKGVSTSGKGGGLGAIGGDRPAPPEGAGGGPGGGGGAPGMGGKGGGGEGGGGDPFSGVGREEGEGPRMPNKFETLVDLREGGTGGGNANEGGNAPGANELSGPETVALGPNGGGMQIMQKGGGRGATVLPKHILRYMRLPAMLCRENKMGVCERLPKLLAKKELGSNDFPSREELIASRVKIPSVKGK